MKSKKYQEGYNFAIRYGEDKLTKEEEKFFDEHWQDVSLEEYNLYKKGSKFYKLFAKGRDDAIKYMWEINEKLQGVERLIDPAYQCYDGMIEQAFDLQEVIECSKNQEELEILLNKYEEGLSVLMSFYEKVELKSPYEV